MTTQERVLKIGEDDWIYLAQVASIVHDEMSHASEQDIINATLGIIRDLVDAEFLVIGDLTGAGGRFKPWWLSTPEAIQQIRTRWLALKRPINLGDVCWFSNTPKGDKMVASLPGEASSETVLE